MKKLFFITLLLPLAVHTQTDTAKLAIIPDRQFRISLTPTVYLPAQLEHLGAKLNRATPSLGIDYGFSYYFHFKNLWGISLGLNFGTMSTNIHIPYEYDDIIGDTNSGIFNDFSNKKKCGTCGAIFDTEYFNFYGALSLAVEKKIRRTSTRFYTVELGIRRNTFFKNELDELSYSTAYSPKLIDSSLLLYEHYLKGNQFGRKDFFSGTFKIGIEKLTQPKEKYFMDGTLAKKTKGYNSLKFNLVFHYTNEIIMRGNYQFYNTAQESKGNITVRMNYIGFEFTYGFTGRTTPYIKP